MKKLVLSMAAFLSLAALSLQAQVTVTYKVDITEYLAAGNTLGAGGMRVGGNFATQSALNGTNPMADWSPSNEFSAMTDQGNNIWAISVTYPTGGATQLFKFVNNDWGQPGVANEGGSASTIGTGGCGVDDGAGNINRTLVIPATNTEVCFAWESCTACGTSSVKSSVVNKLSIAPNPASSLVRLNLSGNGLASASITDLSGKVVKQVNFVLNDEISVSDLNAGMYIVTVTEGSKISQATLAVTK
jgi:hypothetical protein